MGEILKVPKPSSISVVKAFPGIIVRPKIPLHKKVLQRMRFGKHRR